MQFSFLYFLITNGKLDVVVNAAAAVVVVNAVVVVVF